MRTRVGAAVVVAFLLSVTGPVASAHPSRGGGGAVLEHVLMTPREIDEGDTPHLTGNVAGLVTGCGPVGLAINWGDGSATENRSQPGNGSFDFPHTYPDDNPVGTPATDTVTVDLTDQCQGTGHAESSVLVSNVPPQFDSVRVFPRGPRQTTTLDVAFTDPGSLDTFTFTVDWGDAAEPEQLQLPAVQRIRVHHAYPEAGGYLITIGIQDDDGGSDSRQLDVSVPTEVPRIVTAPGGSGSPNVRLFDDQGALVRSIQAFRSSFTGGVRVAAGDVDGDGYDDVVVGAGPGSLPEVRVYSGNDGTLLDEFLAFRSSFTGGVWVAAGDVDGDGFADVVVGAGRGAGPQVRVFHGSGGGLKLSSHFFAFRSSYTGGVRVAVGDVNGDGFADVVCGAGPGGIPQVKVFDGFSLRPVETFHAFRSSFAGGVFVAAGDVDGDGRADVIAGEDAGGAPQVRVFSQPAGADFLQPSSSFAAYRSSFTGGVRVAAGDVNGDGRAEIITAAGAGAGPHVKVFSQDPAGGPPTDSLDILPYRSSFTGGVFVGFGMVRVVA
ncbi:MAG TPA: FG-GAP-like repeat-containing protein [Actinomycetota bacterium]|jgi:hypothetical protein